MRDPPRILVVDDNPANLEILEIRLARQGYEVITARNGDEALVSARHQAPDLILLDVMMRGNDGIQVCRELKADPSLPFMPVILVTAKAAPDDIVAGLDAGGDEYITEPVDHAALVARVWRAPPCTSAPAPPRAEARPRPRSARAAAYVPGARP
jgi:DNA-binding response OmpR family regulator